MVGRKRKKEMESRRRRTGTTRMGNRFMAAAGQISVTGGGGRTSGIVCSISSRRFEPGGAPFLSTCSPCYCYLGVTFASSPIARPILNCHGPWRASRQWRCRRGSAILLGPLKAAAARLRHLAVGTSKPRTAARRVRSKHKEQRL